MGERARAKLTRVHQGPTMIRVRGHAPGPELTGGRVLRVAIRANGQKIGEWPLPLTPTVA